MKVFTEKFLRFFSKFVNIQRVEVFTWLDPVKLEEEFEVMWRLSEPGISVKKNNKKSRDGKNCCKNRNNESSVENTLPCDCNLPERRVA